MSKELQDNSIENEETDSTPIFKVPTLDVDTTFEEKLNNIEETVSDKIEEQVAETPQENVITSGYIQTLPINNTEFATTTNADTSLNSTISMMGKSSLEDTLKTAQQKIVEKASEQISDNTKIDEKAETLAKLVDKQFAVDAETKNVEIEEQNVSNKARKKELRNRLIVLRNEAKRIKKEQKHLNKVQRLEHKAKKKEALWETYGKALTDLGYDYVPNRVTLSILMFLVGAKAFINGMDKIGNALVKCLKWVLIVGGVLAVIFIIPVTREWGLNLLGFIK